MIDKRGVKKFRCNPRIKKKSHFISVTIMTFGRIMKEKERKIRKRKRKKRARKKGGGGLNGVVVLVPKLPLFFFLPLLTDIVRLKKIKIKGF